MLSLDIESGKIRCVEGKITGGKAVISGYCDVKCPEGLGLLDEGAPERLGSLLREGLAKRRVRDRKCTVSLRSDDLFFRRITLPKASAAQLKDMVSHTLNGILTAKDYYVDYTVERQHSEDGKKKLDVLLCGAPKNLAKAYYSMVLAANLIPHKMDAQENYIYRLFSKESGQDAADIKKDAFLLIDAGSEIVSSDLIVQGKSVFERTVSIQSRQNPLDYYDIYNESAAGEPKSSTNEIYAKINDEAGKMLQFSLTKALDRPVSRIYLYGENSSDLRLSERLTSELGIETAPAHGFNCIQFKEGYEGPEICRILGLCAALL